MRFIKYIWNILTKNTCSKCEHCGGYGDYYCRHHYHTIVNKYKETCADFDSKNNWETYKNETKA